MLRHAPINYPFYCNLVALFGNPGDMRRLVVPYVPVLEA
jgi:hypothetical protein